MSPDVKFDRRNTEPSSLNHLTRLHLSTNYESRADMNHEMEEDEVNNVAEFLMKTSLSTNPSPENPTDGEKRNIRNSALKIFSRYRRKKSMNSGISPLSEANNCKEKYSTARLTNSNSASVDKVNRASLRASGGRTSRKMVSEVGTVTVLKPVSEFTETFRAPTKPMRDSTQSDTSIRPSIQDKAQTISYDHPSTPSTIETDSSPQQNRLRDDVVSIESIPQQRDSLTRNSDDKWDQQDNNHAEFIRSGSSFSQLSNSTCSGAYHSETTISRGTSPELYPPRGSSISCFSSRRDEKLKITKDTETFYDVKASTPPKRKAGLSPVSPLIFETGTAKLARSFSGAGIEKACIVRCSSPGLSGIPIVSKASSLSTSRPTSPMYAQLQDEAVQSTLESKGTVQGALRMSPTKMGRTNSRIVRESKNVSRSPGLGSLSDSPIHPCSDNQSSISRSLPQPIGFSNIMVVANVAPDLEQCTDSALITIKRRRSTNWTAVPSIAIANPINHDSEDSRSMSDSSFFEQRSIHDYRSRESLTTNSCAPLRSEQEFYGPEKTTPKNKDVNTRLAKMERDNAMLLATLNGIVKKIGGLSALEPSLSNVSGAAESPEEPDEEEIDLRKLNGRYATKNTTKDVVSKPERRESVQKRIVFSQVRY